MDLSQITLQPTARASETDEYLDTVVSRSFVHKQFKEDIDVYQRYFSFSIDIEKVEEVQKFKKLSADVKACIKEHKAPVNSFTQPSSRGNDSTTNFYSEDFCVKITEWSGKFNVHFLLTKNCSIFADIIEQLEKLSAVNPDERNEFSVLIKSTHGLSTRTLRNGTCPLEPLNYVPEVMEGHEKMVQELSLIHI